KTKPVATRSAFGDSRSVARRSAMVPLSIAATGSVASAMSRHGAVALRLLEIRNARGEPGEVPGVADQEHGAETRRRRGRKQIVDLEVAVWASGTPMAGVLCALNVMGVVLSAHSSVTKTLRPVEADAVTAGQQQT